MNQHDTVFLENFWIFTISKKIKHPLQITYHSPQEQRTTIAIHLTDFVINFTFYIYFIRC